MINPLPEDHLQMQTQSRKERIKKRMLIAYLGLDLAIIGLYFYIRDKAGWPISFQEPMSDIEVYMLFVRILGAFIFLEILYILLTKIRKRDESISAFLVLIFDPKHMKPLLISLVVILGLEIYIELCHIF